jgi:hypothetical protein
MAIHHLLNEELKRYLRGERTAAELRTAISFLTWGVPVWGSQQDVDFVGAVELALSEFEAGHLTEEELRQELAEEMDRRRVIIMTCTQTGVISGASVTPVPALALWTQWADTQRAAEPSWQAVRPA